MTLASETGRHSTPGATSGRRRETACGFNHGRQGLKGHGRAEPLEARQGNRVLASGSTVENLGRYHEEVPLGDVEGVERRLVEMGKKGKHVHIRFTSYLASQNRRLGIPSA